MTNQFNVSFEMLLHIVRYGKSKSVTLTVYVPADDKIFSLIAQSKESVYRKEM